MMETARRLRWVALSFALSACGSHLPGQVDEDGNECPITAPRAEVTLVAYQSAAWVGMDVLSRFQRSAPAREAISCRHRVVGPCEVDECERLGIDFVNGEPTCGYTSAGSLLVTRGASALPRVEGSARLTLERDLAESEPFSVRTTGGDVPAFAAMMTLPRRATVTGPEALTRGGTLALAPGEGFTVTWGPVTSRVLVVVTSNFNGTFTAECAFDGAAGSGAVPVGALPAQEGHVEVLAEERADQRAGAFPVSVRARWATGARATLTRNVP